MTTKAFYNKKGNHYGLLDYLYALSTSELQTPLLCHCHCALRVLLLTLVLILRFHTYF